MAWREKKLTDRYFIERFVVNFILTVLGVLLMFQFLHAVQNAASEQRQNRESEQLLDEIVNTMKENTEEVAQLQQIYDNSNRETLEDLVALLDKGIFDSLTRMTTKERGDFFEDIMDRAGVEYLFLMNGKGTVLLAPVDSIVGQNLVELGYLSEENFSTLLQADGLPVLEENDSGSYYFYSEKIEKDGVVYYLILGTDSNVLELQFSAITDVASVIQAHSGGEDNLLFAVDQASGEFLYYEDENGSLTGENAYDCGLSKKALKNHYAGVQTINGQQYYCVARAFRGTIFICAARDTDALYRIGNRAMGWSILAFVIAIFLTMMYAIILRMQDYKGGVAPKLRVVFRGKKTALYLNHTVGKKLLPLIIGCTIAVFAAAWYAQTLISLSEATHLSESELTKMEQNISEGNLTAVLIENDYDSRYLAKAKLIAFYLEEDPSALNEQEDRRTYTEYDADGNRYLIEDDEGNPLESVRTSIALRDLADSNELDEIYIYNAQGRVIATSGETWHFRLSRNEEDQSYPFWRVLDGRLDYYVQEAGVSEINIYSQYVGVPFHYYTMVDENGNTVYCSREDYRAQQQGTWEGNPITMHGSLLQIALDTELMKRVVSASDISTIVAEETIMEDGFLVIFEASDGFPVIYSPNGSDIGKTAAEIGVSDLAFSGSYSGFQKYNEKNCFQTVRYESGYYIATAIPTETLYEGRAKIALITALNTLLFLVLISGFITITTQKEEELFAKGVAEQEKLHTASADAGLKPGAATAIRWDKTHAKWKDKTPEEKLMTLVRGALTLLVLYIFGVMLGTEKLYGESSILTFILSGGWDRGVNVFAVSACLAVTVLTAIGVWIAGGLISLSTSIFGAKSETIGQLLKSVLKYGSTLVSLFYCMYLMGIESGSLLASAGIVSVVIGLGAQKLIGDILAGVSIVFEGEYRVGDYIKINGERGQVLDIGLRTTKIVDGERNIKIFNNSDISDVVNLSKEHSVAIITFGIDYSEDLEHVERIFEKEFPRIRSELPKILEGPKYRGVVEMADSAVVLRVDVWCQEEDIPQMKRDMMRQMYLVCCRNGISIPFPHTTVNFLEEEGRSADEKPDNGKS